ncbi:MAG: DEAD/DEAH box helicase [Christensenellales bacterium]|jgi:SWI/SNF-related matrix-associated actin-dependent regulator 1 of chromatin subfamily A
MNALRQSEMVLLQYPAYLADAPAEGHIYGTLSYNKRAKCWVIKGEPSVTEFAKRLFPGCAGKRRGEARFTAHRRVVGDLNWLMLRYPLSVKEADVPRWEKALADARDYAIRREAARIAPQTASPDPATFSGELMPFQQEGLAFLLNNRRSLLADEMGLGKTVQSLSFIAKTEGYPVLLVVPPHLMRNWASEAARFLVKDGGVNIHVLRGLTPYELPKADIYIVHYLLLRGWKNALPKMEFKTVVFDEIQELRRSGTEKYSAASLLSDSCENVIGLSGTPIYNHGGEIWNVVNILDYHFLGDWESFTREWCYGYSSAIVAKPDLLGEFLRREGLMLRRIKADVLKQLPPKRRLVQQIDWDDAVYRELMLPVAEKLDALKDAPDASKRALLEEQISMQQRQATGIAKAPFVAAFVKALLDDGEKVLLFAHHHAVMDCYKAEMKSYRPAFITGRETDAEKARSVSRFMEGKTDLCCISLRSASGLNLQRATCVVFGELDWSPAVHSQAEDRAHRIGQEDSLLCYYLVSPKGSDLDMQEALGLKVSQFVQLMGDRVLSGDEQMLRESEARAHIQKLVEKLLREKKEDSGK